jgi:hypothetical protein
MLTGARIMPRGGKIFTAIELKALFCPGRRVRLAHGRLQISSPELAACRSDDTCLDTVLRRSDSL